MSTVDRRRDPRAAWLLAAAVAAGLPAQAARADGLSSLHAFMTGPRGGQADFSQQVTPRDGRPPAPVTGHLAFQRPGQFRWEAAKPYHQLIVADGHSVFLWDPDLNQVTIKSQARALGASPAALLAGDDSRLDQDFELRDGGSSEGLEWVEAVPRSGEVGFDSIRLGFSGHELARMDLRDSFGQLTHIRFGHFERLAARDHGLFEFRTPAGADEIRE
jgi:outer membrane lipoprotein carrier protein